MLILVAVKSLKSPFGGWKIDNLLDEVSTCAESVRVCADGILEEMIVGNYSVSKTIQLQLVEVIRQQQLMQMSIDAAQSKTNLLHFLMEQLSMPLLISGNGVDLRSG